MKANKVREGLALLNSMVCSGELHSLISIEAKTKAFFELAELERLADIGRATEKFLEAEDIIYDVDNYSGLRKYKTIANTDKLLEWAKGGEQ